jgi:hypothetical protein
MWTTKEGTCNHNHPAYSDKDGRIRCFGCDKVLEQDFLTMDQVFKARPKWWIVSAIDDSIDGKNKYRTIWIYDNKKEAEKHIDCMKKGYNGNWIDLRIECIRDFSVIRKR